MAVWDDISARELRIAARVARASGGVVMAGAAASWELRAKIIDEREARLKEWGVDG